MTIFGILLACAIVCYCLITASEYRIRRAKKRYTNAKLKVRKRIQEVKDEAYKIKTEVAEEIQKIKFR